MFTLCVAIEHAGTDQNTREVLGEAQCVAKFSISFTKCFQFCLLQNCLNICMCMLCALIEHAAYTCFGKSERVSAYSSIRLFIPSIHFIYALILCHPISSLHWSIQSLYSFISYIHSFHPIPFHPNPFIHFTYPLILSYPIPFHLSAHLPLIPTPVYNYPLIIRFYWI